MNGCGRSARVWTVGLLLGCSQGAGAPSTSPTQMDGAIERPDTDSTSAPAERDDASARRPTMDAGSSRQPVEPARDAKRPDASAAGASMQRDGATAPGMAVPHAPVGPVDGKDVLLVANKDVGTVELYDAKSFAKLASVNVIPDGKEPQDPAHAPIYAGIVLIEGLNYAQHVLVSVDGTTLYVARGWLGDVVAIELATGSIMWRLQTSSFRADHMALSPDGSRLFVSALSADQVQVIDPARGSFVGSFPTGTWPHGMEFSHDGSKLYTGSIGNIVLPEGMQGRYELTVTDPSTLKVLQTFTFEAGIRPFVLTHDDKLMYTQLSWFHGIAEVELASGRTLRKTELPVSEDAKQVARSDYPNDAAHHGLAISHDGAVLCAAGTLSDYVALVDRASFELIKTIPVGDEPGWTVTSLDGQYCFAGARGAKSISVISYAEQRELARIPVGGLPQHLLLAKIPSRVLNALAPSSPLP